MSIDIENLTGNETPEELEALLDSIGDVEVSDTPGADTSANAGDLAAETNPFTQQENKGDTNTSTLDVTTEQQVETAQPTTQTMTPQVQQQPTAEELKKLAGEKLAEATAAANLPASPSDVGSTTSSSAASPLE
ncbi:hypothetical protein [Brenneria rubrifaciens]|uniref:Uncharacterized protein n=1 Tax=Brenneria rubrifaciens TaxID=55213 RepID=A0A4V1F9U1_9GAMM|nr:hypothetical protein [Brenneria rubrifaciens]QCR08753.1 hypothetical protein EH207_09530 [Brenneria rubrifaciens]